VGSHQGFLADGYHPERVAAAPATGSHINLLLIIRCFIDKARPCRGAVALGLGCKLRANPVFGACHNQHHWVESTIVLERHYSPFYLNNLLVTAPLPWSIPHRHPARIRTRTARVSCAEFW